MLRVGLTGGIGSGKSTVAKLLVARGAALVDTDAIARSLTLAEGAAIAPIRDAFGPQFIADDGSLDRPRMREAVFADTDVKRRLEAVLHPLIGLEIERQMDGQHADIVILDIPLLVESGRWRGRIDRVWVIDCSEGRQVERVVARSGWAPAAIEAVISQQASRVARRAAADAVIDNDAITPEQLALEVAQLWQQTIADSTRPAVR